MTHLQIMLWLCVAAYGAHVLEEFVFDWRTWSQQVLHLPTRWEDFYITNCLVIVVGIVAVEIAPEYPAVALGFPGLMLINATFMHVFPFLRTKGRFSPGLITGVLFLLASWNLHHARSRAECPRNKRGIRCRCSASRHANRIHPAQTQQLLRPDTALLNCTAHHNLIK